MRFIFSTILLLSFFTISAQNKTTCLDFKTGKFKYSNPEYSEWSVTRNDTIQIETSTKTGFTVYSKIDWKTDCEYTLTCQRIENSDLKVIGKVFKTQITEVFENRYKCILKSNDFKKDDLHLEMIKIE